MKFTRAARQKIVQEFAEENGGWFDPALFLATIEEEGETHPAWGWFEWDDDKAALEFRLDQARDFARGLVVRFEVQEIRRGKFRVTERSVPLLLSPLDKRRTGGGYYITDPDDPAHIRELKRQAAQSLRWFISRYEAVLGHVGALQSLERVESLLAPDEHQEAA